MRSFVDLGSLVALRDSEPKRAYYADGYRRHSAHVLINFRLRKFIGGSSREDPGNKRGWYPLDILIALRDSEPKRAYYA